jgi:Na+/melibiose symporter-like transporter
LSGESSLDKYISHRLLYILGFLSGWHPRVISIEFLPITYFLTWSIVLFALRENQYAYLFLGASLGIILYFILLHTVFSSWDKIKRWLIRRARTRGGISNLTLEDVKYLMIYTRKVFGVRAVVSQKADTTFNPNKLRELLKSNKNWRFALNITIIIELLGLTGGGIYLFMHELDIMLWLADSWYFLFLFLIPIIIVIIGLVITRERIKEIINSIPIDKFDEVLYILNEFKIYGGQNIK